MHLWEITTWRQDSEMERAKNNGEMWAQKVCWQLSVKLSKSSHNFVDLGPCTKMRTRKPYEVKRSWNGQTMKLILWRRYADAHGSLETISRLDLWLTLSVDCSDRHDFAPEVHLMKWCDADMHPILSWKLLEPNWFFGSQSLFVHFCAIIRYSMLIHRERDTHTHSGFESSVVFHRH